MGKEDQNKFSFYMRFAVGRGQLKKNFKNLFLYETRAGVSESEKVVVKYSKASLPCGRGRRGSRRASFPSPAGDEA
jgi:hypothetical protein